MSVTISGTENGRGTWVSVTEAAVLAHVSERTVQRWIEGGRVVSDMSDDGRRRVRRESVPGADELVRRHVPDERDGGEQVRRVSDTSDTLTDATSDTMSDVAGGPTLNDVSHGVSPPDSTSLLVESLRQHIDTLTSQLDARAQAEAELRRLLLLSQQALTAVIERPMLPAASISNNVLEKPRVRWWQLWRRQA